MKQEIRFPINLKPSLKWFYLSLIVIAILLFIEYIVLQENHPWFVNLIIPVIILGIIATWRGIKTIRIDDQKITAKFTVLPFAKKEIRWRNVKRIVKIMDETPHQKSLPTIRIEGKNKNLWIQDHYKEGLTPIFMVAKNLKIKIDYEYEKPISEEHEYMRYYEEDYEED